MNCNYSYIWVKYYFCNQCFALFIVTDQTCKYLECLYVTYLAWSVVCVDSSWNVMSHDDGREGKWRGNWRMEWVASTLHTTSEHGVSSITTADAHTSAASSRLNWTLPPADLNGHVRFAERRNLVSARVPSHFKRSLLTVGDCGFCSWLWQWSVSGDSRQSFACDQ